MRTSWQAVIVIAVALSAVVLVVVAAFHWLPGATPEGQTDNTTAAITGITGAAMTAIGSAIGAFFGIRAASNAADQAQGTATEAQKTATESQKTVAEAQKQNRLAAAQLAEVSGVGDKDDVAEALQRGAQTAQSLGG